MGPTDLSQAFGVTGQTGHPVLEQAYDLIAEAVSASPAALGVLVADETGVERWQRRGASYIAVTIDSLIASRARGLLRSVSSGAV